MPDVIPHPELADCRAVQANYDRLASYVDRPAPRNPWTELRDAASAMATATDRLATAWGTEGQADAQRESDRTARAFGAIRTELQVCYMGVRVAHCGVCDRFRRMSEPREWEAEIVELGGPEVSVECLTCGQTIVVEPSRPRSSDERRTLGEGAEDAGSVAEPISREGLGRPSAHATKDGCRRATPTAAGDDAACMRHDRSTTEGNEVRS